MKNQPNRTRRPARQLFFILTGLLLTVRLASAAPAPQAENRTRPAVVKNTPRVQVGKACVERLGSIFTDGAGPFIAAKAGDWRLSNEFVSVTFASVEPAKKVVSQPVGGYHEIMQPAARIPGAVIDVAADGEVLDFLGSLTQGISVDADGPVLQYDTAKPVKRDKEVGLQLEGSPFETASLRVQTTYWLAGGSHRIRIETTFTGLPEGEAAPQLSDVGQWGIGTLLVQDHGVARGDKSIAMNADFFLCRGGELCAGIAPVAGKVEGNFTGLPPSTRVTYVVPKPEDKSTTATQAADKNKATTASQAKGKAAAKGKNANQTAKADKSKQSKDKQAKDKQEPKAAATPEEAETPKVILRDLWLAKGNYAALSEKILTDRKIPTGTITGQIVQVNTTKTVAGNAVQVLRIDPAHLEEKPKLYTVTMTDKAGRYTVKLPVGHYFLKPESKSQFTATRMLIDCKVEAGKSKTRDLQSFPESGVEVKVIDAQTSRPLAAHVYLEPIPPTPPVDFGFPKSASGYTNHAYLPKEGNTLIVPDGRWVIHAIHGIHYELSDREVVVEKGKVAKCVIPLKEVNPTPGWLGLELGVRTKATPGCTIEPRDIVLMAAAEGIDWLVSGDYDTITDLSPEIRKAGLEKTLGFSRGFRTMLPTHPEWGQFLLYPINEASAQPSLVRHEWENAKTAKEFIATLRRLYPEALIQCELPYTQDGQGYFAMPGKNAYQISFDPNPNLELGIDALNLFPARQAWNSHELTGFWNSHLARGRFYLPSTSSSARTVFGAEPGYPRLLVWTDHSSPTEVSEADLAKALRAHHVQLTTGPFIDFRIGEARPGDIVAADHKTNVRLRVTSPEWINIDSMTIDKEGAFQLKMGFNPDNQKPQRYPEPDSGDKYSQFPLSQLRLLVNFKDTLLGVTVQGSRTLNPILPAMQPSEAIMPLAITFPIIVDANGNGKYDPLKAFRDIGR